MSAPVEIRLSKEEAFALFAFVARYTYDGQLSVSGETEATALRELCHALDDQLVELFRADYLRLAAERNR